MRHNSRRTGYARGHHSLRGHAYADGGDRGLLWARSLRWDRNNKFHSPGPSRAASGMTASGTMARDDGFVAYTWRLFWLKLWSQAWPPPPGSSADPKVGSPWSFGG